MNKVLLASVAAVALSGSLLADTVTGTGTFTAFPSGFASSTPTWISNFTNPGAGTPFWNNASDDTGIGPGEGSSHLMNVGYVMTNTGGMTGATPVLGSDTVSTDYIGAGGADPTAFNFVRNAVAYDITLLFADSSDNTGMSWLGGSAAVGSVLGYYVGGTFTPIYTVGQTTSATGTQAFNPGVAGTTYGFYDTVCYAVSAGLCTDYATYTTADGTFGNDMGGAAWNHFAVFQLASGNYVVGFTGANGLFGENLGDFQDTVIELVAIPEPGTVAIMGLGLAAIGLLGRRRFVRS